MENYKGMNGKVLIENLEKINRICNRKTVMNYSPPVMGS